MKERIDVLLAQRGLADSREKAKALIMAGLVFADGQRVDKPGATVAEHAEIEVHGQQPFVSRGGQKLERAIQAFEIGLAAKVCADIGASTGGFTDCMLQHGAAKVYAVDVGYGQLAWPLRNDVRVINLERTNARALTETEIPDKLDFFSVDVSFISLKLILPPLVSLLAPGADGVCLIKPQFEAGRDKVGKNGVVRAPETHAEVIRAVLGYVQENGLYAAGLAWSPIKGPKGNIEYLAYISTDSGKEGPIDIKQTVADAHRALREDQQ